MSYFYKPKEACVNKLIGDTGFRVTECGKKLYSVCSSDYLEGRYCLNCLKKITFVGMLPSSALN